jgi:ankyrin repeat protein
MRTVVALLLFALCQSLHAQPAVTRLFDAIDEGKPLVAEGILAREKVDVNAINKERETPLHRAVEKGMKELVELLLKKGRAPVPAPRPARRRCTSRRCTADPVFAELLLAAGADPKVRNDHGESALHWAALSGNPLTLQRLLARGADANVRDQKGNLPLHGAADGGHDGVAKLLLRARTSRARRTPAARRRRHCARARLR